MKKRGQDFLKNSLIAILGGYFVGTIGPWVNANSAWCIGFITAELIMYFFTAYDEIIRQRKRRRR